MFKNAFHSILSYMVVCKCNFTILNILFFLNDFSNFCECMSHTFHNLFIIINIKTKLEICEPRTIWIGIIFEKIHKAIGVSWSFHDNNEKPCQHDKNLESIGPNNSFQSSTVGSISFWTAVINKIYRKSFFSAFPNSCIKYTKSTNRPDDNPAIQGWNCFLAKIWQKNFLDIWSLILFLFLLFLK